MERRLVTVAGAAIVIAGTLLHFVYGWSGRNLVAGLISPVSESVWEHTKLLVFPVVAAGMVEAAVLRDVRRVEWATLVESILGALAIVAVFYTYTGALGTRPILWVEPAAVGRSSVLICPPCFRGRARAAAARAYVRKTLAKMSHASSDLAVRLKMM